MERHADPGDRPDDAAVGDPSPTGTLADAAGAAANTGSPPAPVDDATGAEANKVPPAEPVEIWPEGGEGGAPTLALDGFSGPLDHLLALARAQKIDLSRISLAALVDQLVAALRRPGRRIPLGQKADWVVMAAWLAAHWGITDRLRQVSLREGATTGRRLKRGHTVIGYGFFTAGDTPHAAIAALPAGWPALRFALVPRPAD